MGASAASSARSAGGKGLPSPRRGVSAENHVGSSPSFASCCGSQTAPSLAGRDDDSEDDFIETDGVREEEELEGRQLFEHRASPEEQDEEDDVPTHEDGLPSRPHAARPSAGRDGLERAGAAAPEVRLPRSGIQEDLGPVEGVDLRKFLRAGDLLNYIGGNSWGHVVLLLDLPRLLRLPKLFDFTDKDHPNPRLIGQNVPAYICRTFQSASNMKDMGLALCALVLHPLCGGVSPVKQVPGLGFQICAGREGPVTMEFLLSPLSNETLDFRLFRLCVEELRQMPVDTKWSFRTAVRGYLRHAELKPGNYATEKLKRSLARDIFAKWQKRPICSTVPPRIWQKYLLKQAYAQETSDPDVRWVTDVLRMMPVKDDRVLPAELVKILLGTGRWHRADLTNGPPMHRLDDGSPEALQQACEPVAREALPEDLKNSEGVPVFLGDNGFDIYCGRQFAKPQKIWAAKRSGGTQVDWDGRCGPRKGPQCPQCRWLEDTLPE